MYGRTDVRKFKTLHKPKNQKIDDAGPNDKALIITYEMLGGCDI